MSKKTKFLIGLLVMIVFAEGWIIYKTYNLENRVIPLNSFIFNNGLKGYADNYVSSEGTWVSDTELAYPINSSIITCVKSAGFCIEALGQLSSSGNLIVDSTIFDIQTWNEREIVTSPNLGLCTRYIMRLDRIQKQVTSTRTTIKNVDECVAVDKAPMHLYLEDGLKAWQRLQKKK